MRQVARGARRDEGRDARCARAARRVMVMFRVQTYVCDARRGEARKGWRWEDDDAMGGLVTWLCLCARARD